MRTPEGPLSSLGIIQQTEEQGTETAGGKQGAWPVFPSRVTCVGLEQGGSVEDVGSGPGRAPRSCDPG